MTNFGSRLEHTVSIVRRTPAGESEYGLDVFSEAVLSTAPAAIQPRSERELDLVSQAGSAVDTHTVYLFPIDVKGGDWILHDQGDCPMVEDLPNLRLEVDGIRNAAGRGHHLELGVRAVQAAEDATGS